MKEVHIDEAYVSTRENSLPNTNFAIESNEIEQEVKYLVSAGST